MVLFEDVVDVGAWSQSHPDDVRIARGARGTAAAQSEHKQQGSQQATVLHLQGVNPVQD